MSLADVNFLLSRLVPSCGGAAVFLRVPQRELLFIAAVRTFALQQAQTWPRRISTLLSPTLGGAALFDLVPAIGSLC
jgi:hypothetical protein